MFNNRTPHAPNASASRRTASGFPTVLAHSVQAGLGSLLEPLETRTLLSAALNFSPEVDYHTGRAPVAIAAGNLDGDGKTDIVTANFLGNSLSVELGNEIANTIGGSQGRDATINTPLSGRPIALALGDYNGDGKTDVAVIERFTTFDDAGNVTVTNKLFVLSGKGDGHFGSPVECDGSVRPTALVTANLTGRGNDQLIVADSADGSVDVFTGSLDHGFTHVVYSAADKGGSMRLATGDFNGDGKVDVVTVSESDGTANFLLGTDNGALLPAVHTAMGVKQVSSITAGNFNDPLRAELVVASSGDGSVRTFAIQGFPGDRTAAATIRPNLIALLHPVETSRTDYGSPITAVQAADFNGDGKTDLVASGPLSNVEVQLGNGDGTFSRPTSHRVRYGAYALAVGDFNGDGTTDVAAAETQVSAVAVLFNKPITSLSVLSRPIFGQRAVPLVNARVASFSDVLFGAPPNYYAATIDWGDGSAVTFGVVTGSSQSGFDVLGSHTYATAGLFTVHVNIKPNAGVGATVTDIAAIGGGRLGGLNPS